MIANITASLSRNAGGLFYSILGLVKAQRALGADVQVWGTGDEYQQKDSAQWGGIPLHVFPVLGPRNFGFAPGFFESLVKADPELVHQHGIWMYPSVAADRWRGRNDRPVMISPHGMLAPWALRNSAWKKRLACMAYEGRNLRLCACFRALCQTEMESIQALKLNRPIATIPSGINLPMLNAGSEERNQHPRIMLYLGRIYKVKNLLTLVRAWQNLPKQLTRNWRLRLAGWGDEDYRRMIRLICSEEIMLEGPLFGEEKDNAFRSASAFILPSLSEGLPMAILEAWSYQIPVLMSEECNLSKGFEIGAAINTGISDESVTAALDHFLKMSESKQNDMGYRGRRLVEEQFTWSSIATKMNAVSLWMLGKAEKPSWVTTA